MSLDNLTFWLHFVLIVSLCSFTVLFQYSLLLIIYTVMFDNGCMQLYKVYFLLQCFTSLRVVITIVVQHP